MALERCMVHVAIYSQNRTLTSVVVDSVLKEHWRERFGKRVRERFGGEGLAH